MRYWDFIMFHQSVLFSDVMVYVFGNIRSTYVCRNSQGYEMAKKFSNKFTHLSPVWYELKGYVRTNEIFHSKSPSLEIVLFAILL